MKFRFADSWAALCVWTPANKWENDTSAIHIAISTMWSQRGTQLSLRVVILSDTPGNSVPFQQALRRSAPPLHTKLHRARHTFIKWFKLHKQRILLGIFRLTSFLIWPAWVCPATRYHFQRRRLVLAHERGQTSVWRPAESPSVGGASLRCISGGRRRVAEGNSCKSARHLLPMGHPSAELN